MGYFLLESVIISFFVSFVWRFFIEQIVDVKITYVQWVAIIWIIKVVFFDVFKLLAGFNSINNQKEIQKQEP